MNGARATKNISLVLVSSLLVFGGWTCGDYLREEAEHPGAANQGHAGGQHVRTSGGGSHFFWWHSGYYYGGGSGGRVGGGTSRGRPNAAPSTSARGGFGSSGHAAGA
jgi:hypothetical protein